MNMELQERSEYLDEYRNILIYSYVKGNDETITKQRYYNYILLNNNTERVYNYIYDKLFEKTSDINKKEIFQYISIGKEKVLDYFKEKYSNNYEDLYNGIPSKDYIYLANLDGNEIPFYINLLNDMINYSGLKVSYFTQYRFLKETLKRDYNYKLIRVSLNLFTLDEAKNKIYCKRK